MKARESTSDAWPDLVDRLAAHDVRYLIGGSAWDGRESPYSGREEVPLAPLLLDLAHAPEARLQNAIIALFLRHPEDVAIAEALTRDPSLDEPARQILLLSILVAAALESEWSFSIDLYLPNRSHIRAEHLAVELGMPSPADDFGRSCLTAAAERLRAQDPFPFNYEADWEDTVRRLLAQLARDAGHRGT